MTIELTRPIGQGHFGEVWLGFDRALDRPVAAKFIDVRSLGRPVSEMFAEAQALLNAHHEHVVEVYAAEDQGGQPVVVMEYLEEGSVEDRYGSQPVPVRTALDIASQACRGLAHAHGKDLLHRDVKPGNLLVSPTGSIKLSDFGLACSSRDVTAGPLVGYRPHLPPESVEDGYISDVAGDIYAVGVTLYRLLNGDDHLHQTVEPGDDLDALVKAGRFPDRDLWLPHVPAAARRVAKAAMHLDPASRPANADALRRKIEQAFPQVSFECNDPGQPLTSGWRGVSADNRDVWEIDISHRVRARDFHVEVRRSRDGKPARRVTQACGQHNTNKQAMDHAKKMMADIARSG